MDRQLQNMEQFKGRPVTALDAARANDFFDSFLNANTLKTILGTYRSICDLLHLKPNVFPLFYPKLKAHLTSWRAKALWKKFDARANNKCYGKGKLCPNTRVLIIGAGPCGLRSAIEAQLLGAKVVVVEKRDRISRNNVLHLWPFVIDDLRLLGAKKFFGKFCAGAIDHISIRQLQCILLKVALLLGVEIHTEVSFEQLVEPNPEQKTGWTAAFKPIDHPVNQFEFDVVIGADGKRNTLQGFKRKEFRGKLAIAITANFINKRTEAEARVEEISGVAFIFNQKFFKDLFAETGIDLENIVYYKDDTHYFVMTAKKHSLIDKGVIKQDLQDTAKLLAHENVDRSALMNYAREAAEFSTNYKMLDLDFAVNHYGQPDVAMFDFTSMYQAENASRIVDRYGYKLLSILVGDSLLEPFWPTGSGCARGFLSSLDAGWAIRAYGSGLMTPLEVIAERESIYRLLPQTTPENLNRDYKSYTLDPATRYPNLNRNLLLPQQVLSLYDSDDVQSIELHRTPMQTSIIPEKSNKRRRRDSNVDPHTLLAWIKDQVKEHEDLIVADLTTSLKDGRILCAIINHYRPDLLDYSAITAEDAITNNEVAFDLLEREIGIPPVMTAEDMVNSSAPDYKLMVNYLTQIYDAFRCEIPHIKHPKLDLPDIKRHQDTAFTKSHPAIKPALAANSSALLTNTGQHHKPLSRHRRHIEMQPSNFSSNTPSHDKKPRKRRILEKVAAASVEERTKRLEEIASNRTERQNKRRQHRKMQTEQFIKSMQMLQANSITSSSEPFEDYSIFLYRQTAPNFEDRVKDLEKKFTYVPDRENRAPTAQLRGEKDEDFQARIKGMEDKWHENIVTDKKPKDLLRAIGKIDNTDWNIKEIEKKINENKLGKTNVNKDKEKVPKWSREQFQARQMKMEKQHLERQDSAGDKFAEIDKNIRQLDQKLKEGTIREQNRHKVAEITEKLKPKGDEPKPIQRTVTKPTITLPNQGKSETCHFCDKRVYLMERLSAEGKYFHKGCFRCQYCHTPLRLGSYMFDRDGKYGYRFYCAQHFGQPGEIKQTKIVRKPSQRLPDKSPEKKLLSNVTGVDLLDRVQTPERIEFDLSAINPSSDHDEPLSQMDEDEWTDRNFGASTAELGSSDEDDSSITDSDSDNDDAFEEALEEPPTKEGTLKLFNLYKKRYSQKHRNDSDSDSYSSSDRSSYYENSSGDDDSDTATEGEEEIQAREQRKKEVQVKPPIVHTDTGTDTEIASDETSSSSEVQNSATEISTDSEFAQDDPTPTCEIPSIVFNDMFVTKTRGTGKSSIPQKVQVKSTELQKPIVNTASNIHNVKPSCKDIELKFTPLVQTPIRKPVVAPLLLRTEGFALNRTQSTGGIATKVSLELKKKYLLGENSSSNSIQKSGSASTLDSKFKSFHSTISDCQKLLKPSTEISASMQTFCNKLDEQRTSPLSPLALNRSNAFKMPDKVNGITDNAQIEIDGQVSSAVSNLLANEDETKEIVTNTSESKDIILPCIPNEPEDRPRSPVHETSIIVPQIDWSQQNKDKQLYECTTDSSSSSTSDSEENKLQKSPSVKAFDDVQPITNNADLTKNVEVDHILLDSLNYVASSNMDSQPISIQDQPKSISGEKKLLNQPKVLPKLDEDLLLQKVHSVLHKPKPEENTERMLSGRSTPSHESGVDQLTAALTETELSDWARDGLVSDDFEESDYDAKDLQIKDKLNVKKKATLVEAENMRVLPMLQKGIAYEEQKIECISNILCPSLKNIEFMDTGSESSEDESNEIKNNGYVQFHDEDDIAEDSLSPIANLEINSSAMKATFDEDFDAVSTVSKNTGYCIIDEQNPYGGEVIDLKPIDLEKLKEKQSLNENEEDSLIIVERSTTDDNTCSDSTVKNVTDLVSAEHLCSPSVVLENNNTLDKQKRLEDKLAQVKKDMRKLSEQRKAERIEEQNQRNNIEFEQHCQRLQSKVDFGNAKDSIDIRKARRQSKSGSPPKPDLIQEEKETAVSPIRSRKEQIELERDLNKKLVQEMVMTKMRAENKSLERKRRSRNFSPNLSPSRPFELAKSPTTDIASHLANPTPDVLLSTINTPIQKSETLADFQSERTIQRTKILPLSSSNNRPLSAFMSRNHEPIKSTDSAMLNSEAFSLPDIQKAMSNDYKTPKAPPRTKNDSCRMVDKIKEDARARARLLSDEDLGLSPEEKLAQLRLRLARRGKENDDIQVHVMKSDQLSPIFYKNDTLSKKKNASFRRSKSGDDHLNLKIIQPARERTKSFGEMHALKLTVNADGVRETTKCFKSDPNLLLDDVEIKRKEKKPKDRERRKSITKLITDLFAKKKEFNVNNSNSNSNKGFLSRISPKTKDKSKDMIKEESVPIRRMSYTEVRRPIPANVSPPPIPPLPLNYTGAKSIEDSSDGEGEWKRNDRSSCDTLDQSAMQEYSWSSRRSSNRSARKVRQSQSKRHRMAQEIQRKLEETDVKTRDLELRGIHIEKALRGESDSLNKDETELLKEWFDLMRDITQLRRYERELMVRAQELELEDRHARLQHELKERLNKEDSEFLESKTDKDIETESSIIKEMLDIVAKRDSLIALLEEERLRYLDEDKRFEEQMLSKGITLSTAGNSSSMK